MFRGLHNVNLDAKGRLAIPSKYRDELAALCAGRLVITRDIEDRCLLIYPEDEWMIIEQKVQALPGLDKTIRKFQRILIGHASELEMDANGRITLPQALREYALLDKELVLMGQGKKIELWSKAQWQICSDEYDNTEEMHELPAELLELSL